jgi:hypothetical protein
VVKKKLSTHKSLFNQKQNFIIIMNNIFQDKITNEKKQICEMTKNELTKSSLSAQEKQVLESQINNNFICKENCSSESEENDEEDSKNKINDSIKNGKWTEEEDEQLKRLVTQLGAKNWKKVSLSIPTRSAVQCLHRWTKILQPGLVKGPWTIEEDKKLTEWVNKKGPHKWSHCAEAIPGRSGKQCRERWFNTLNPEVKKGEWTAEEDFRIFELFSKYGSKWSKIASHFQGRTENSIKNRFYSTLRRIYAEKKKLEGHSPSGVAIDKNSTSLDDLLINFDEALEEKRQAYLNNSHHKQSERFPFLLNRKIKRENECEESESEIENLSKYSIAKLEPSRLNSKNNDFSNTVNGYNSKMKNNNNDNFFSTDIGKITSNRNNLKVNNITINNDITHESTNHSPFMKNLEPSKLQNKKNDNLSMARSEFNLNKINNIDEKINQNVNNYYTQNNSQLNNLSTLNNQLAAGLSMLPTLVGQPYRPFNQNLQFINLLSELARINQNLINTRNEICNFDAIKNSFLNLASNANIFNQNLMNCNQYTPK